MSMRCFIAIEIENPMVLAKVLQVKKELSGMGLDLKPVEDENIHLTIRFLGNISPYSVEVLKNILSSLGQEFHRFELEVKGLGAFPTIDRPRVVWIGVAKGSEELYSIRKYIDDEIVKRRLMDVHEDDDFHPHITIARVKSLRNVHLLHKFYERYSDYLFGYTMVTKVKLKQSILRPQGPVYRDLYIADLG